MDTAQPIRIISTQDRNTLEIMFLPTDVCNFNCSYCLASNVNLNKFRYPKNLDLVVKNFRRMFDCYTAKLGKSRFRIMFTGGGEPTLWPHIEDFCKQLKSTHDVYTSLITNGSRTLRWWEDNSKYFDNVVLSTHHEFVNIEHHCNVADALYERGSKVTAIMLMDASHWDKCIGMVDRMHQSRHPWFIEAKAIVEAPNRGMDVYTEDQLNYLKQSLKRIPSSDWVIKRYNELRPYESIAMFSDGDIRPMKPADYIVNNWYNFKGWSCNIALEEVFVNFDGSVKGGCGTSPWEGKDFNIFSENFFDQFNLDLEITPVICPKNECYCQQETHNTKVKV